MSATLSHTPARSLRRPALPQGSRTLLLAIVAASTVAGFLLTGSETATQASSLAGEDLTRLLRGMALIKALMALAATAGVVWRLGTPATLSRWSAYALAAAAMAAGPGLIWGMAHVGLGAFLLHAGLVASVLLLWRDPAVAARLTTLIAARRTSHPVAGL